MVTDSVKTVREKIGMTEAEFIEMGRIGAIFYEQGNFEKALTIFEGLVELDPQNAAARAALGGVLTQLQRDDQALVHLNRAVELNGQEIGPYVNRAEIFIRKQRLEEAVENLKQAIDLDPLEQDAGANRARAMVLGLHEAFKLKTAEGVM